MYLGEIGLRVENMRTFLGARGEVGVCMTTLRT